FELYLKQIHECYINFIQEKMITTDQLSSAISQLQFYSLDCVHFCQRNASKLEKNEREQMWLKFLDQILELSSLNENIVSELNNETVNVYKNAFRRIYGGILNSMIGYVTLPGWSF
ncbi:unnamed protein product, partial [Didymodactylos carnosus]